MGRRKRASMREGPLADLFRSTVDDPPADPPEAPRLGERREEERETSEEPTRAQGPPAEEPEDAPTEQVIPEPPRGPEPISVSRAPEEPRVERPSVPEPTRALPEPKDRLKTIFADREPDMLSPRYGRDQPAIGEPARPHNPVIRVVGVGGAGVNAINRMVEAQIPGVEFMAVNTDLQSLQQCIADVTIHIGEDETKGLGTGADPELGYTAAFQEQDKVKRLLKGSDMVFVAAGAGGGTGTGAAPVGA